MLKLKALLAKLVKNASDSKIKLDTISYDANCLHLKKATTSFQLTFPAGDVTLSATIPLSAPAGSTCTVPISISGWYVANNYISINGLRIQGNDTDGYRVLLNCRHHNRTSDSGSQTINDCYLHIIWRNPEDTEYVPTPGGGGTVDVTAISDDEIYAITREEDE